MTSLHPSSLLTLAVLAAMSSMPAQAQDGGYYYGGIGLGQTRARIDDTRMAESLLSSNLSNNDLTHTEHHTAYKVFGGYQFNRYVGMELGYFHLGRFGFDTTTTPAGTINGEFRVQGANVDVVGTLPFTENFSGLARVGAQYARTRTAVHTTGLLFAPNPAPSDRETNVKVGLGLQYAFSPSFLMRGEVERFRVSDAVGNHPRVSMVSMSLVFPFGRSDAPARRAMAAPVVVSQAPAPMAPAPQPMMPMAPQVVAAAPMAAVMPVALPAPAPVRRVTYSAESLFGFDRAVLRPEGKAALDTFVGELRGTSFDSILVQGHADRIGSVAYNQTLSLERAESVKAYLVSSAQLDASRITTVGKSESEPVTAPGDCKGAVSASLIACLQPDRRVEIEVTGTR